MNTKIKTGIAFFLLLAAMSCTKENINSPSSNAAQVSNSAEDVTSHHIGDSYHGGIIFYVDNTGKHGLIAATSDQGVENAWKNGANVVTGATGTAMGTGAANTDKIVAAQGSTGSYAALLCANYEVGRFKDWYLPSKDELNLLYQQKVLLGIAEGDYWSSSETSKSKAWDQEFGGGFQFKDSKSFTLHVRAVSSF